VVMLAATFAPASAKPRVAYPDLPAKASPAGDQSTNDAGSPAIEYVDSFGGIIPTFAVSGTLAFLLQGSALTVLDISAPAAPTRIGHMPLLWHATMLAVTDGIVYVASNQTMQIVDTRNPALPVELARFQARGNITHIQVAGTSAYLTETFNGMEVVDVSDASHPFHVAQYVHLTDGARILVIGNLAYVIDLSNVLAILDISNPSAPLTRGTFTLSSPAQTSFENLVVVGNHAYINAFTDTPAGPQSRLVTLDITHPENPLLLGNIEIPASLVAVAGNIAYVLSSTQLQLFDITDPAQPVAHGVYQGALAQAGGAIVQVDANRIYLVEDPTAFKILDASNLDNLTVLGSYATLAGLNIPQSIQVVGSTGYVLIQGLQILDLTNPISPTLRGYYPSPYAIDVHVFGTRAYLKEAVGPVELLDISNPDQPTLIGTLYTDEVQAVDQANNRAYFLTSDRTGCTTPFCTIRHHKLTIFDVSNPSTPVREGTIQLFESDGTEEGSVIVKGGFAYIAWEGALRIVDVHTAAAPLVRATYPLAQSRNLMQMVGNLAYVTSAVGLTILDLTDPLKPVALGQTGSLGDGIYSIQVQGSLAFVGGSAGVRVVDVSDPRRPIPRASYADVLGQVEALDDIIYVAGSIDGLHVLRLHPDRFPPPMFVPLARH
jgi:hypothetical protein